MITYPSIARDPLSVSRHLFACIGNGYEWHKGELVCHMYRGEKKCKTMDFSDLDERETKLRDDMKKEPAYVSPLSNTFLLEIQFERMRRKFIAENMKTLLDGSCTVTLNSNSYPGGHYVTKNICTKYARAFSFPDDIKLDWAIALTQFIDWWLVALNSEYGVRPERDRLHDRSFWPEEAQDAYTTLLEARKRLYPITHKGETWEAGQERQRKFMDEVLKALKKPEPA